MHPPPRTATDLRQVIDYGLLVLGGTVALVYFAAASAIAQ
jgi:hypothetical protein